MAFSAPTMPGTVDPGRAFMAVAFNTRIEEFAASRLALGQSGEVVTLNAFVVDNDLRHGTFAGWLARSSWAPPYSADEVEGFWARLTKMSDAMLERDG